MDEKKNTQPISKIRCWIGRVSLWVGMAAIAWLLSPLYVADRDLNEYVSLFSFWGIWFSFGIACVFLPLRAKARAIGATFFFFIGTMLATFLVMAAAIGGAGRYEVLDSVDFPHSKVIAYKSDPGAMGSCHIGVDQEMPLLPGIVLKKNLHWSKGYKATLEAAGPNSVLVTVDYDDKTTEYPVRSWVYF